MQLSGELFIKITTKYIFNFLVIVLETLKAFFIHAGITVTNMDIMKQHEG